MVETKLTMIDMVITGLIDISQHNDKRINTTIDSGENKEIKLTCVKDMDLSLS